MQAMKLASADKSYLVLVREYDLLVLGPFRSLCLTPKYHVKGEFCYKVESNILSCP